MQPLYLLYMCSKKSILIAILRTPCSPGWSCGFNHYSDPFSPLGRFEAQAIYTMETARSLASPPAPRLGERTFIQTQIEARTEGGTVCTKGGKTAFIGLSYERS